MSVIFSTKLDYLMKLTNTKNIELSRAIFVDPSIISRLRLGKRRLPKGQSFVGLMGQYFATQIKSMHQHRALMEMIGQNEDWPCSYESIEQTIESWLLDDKSLGEDTALNTNIQFYFKTDDTLEKKALTKESSPNSFFYGEVGKQQALITLLNKVINEGKPRMIYLYSDESMAWLRKSKTFRKLFDSLMKQCFDLGVKFRIIHNLDRSFNEMIGALSGWIPLYLSGYIEPYYYPRIRDKVFRRTMIIVPGIAAINSSSFGGESGEYLNQYIEEKKAIAALELEYNAYFNLCLPLMTVFTPDEDVRALALIKELATKDGNSILLTSVQCLYTLSEKIHQKLKTTPQFIGLDQIIESCHAIFFNSLKKNEFKMIQNVHATKDIKKGAFSKFFMVELSEEDNALNVEYQKELMEKYPNYKYVESQELKGDFLIFCKEEVGVFMVRFGEPEILCAFNEASVIRGFYAYLSQF